MAEGNDAPPHWLNRRRLVAYPRIFIGMFLLMGALWILAAEHGVDRQGKPLGYDFIAFWSASELARSGEPAAAYDVQRLIALERAVVPGIRTVHPWQYPPTYLLVVWPLSLLPYLWSFLLFMGATLCAYLAVGRRIIEDPRAMPLLLAFPGVFFNIFQGQNAFLTAALMGAALIQLPVRPLLAGFLIGLLSIKPHLGLLIPLALACAGCWRAFLAAAVTSLAFLGLSVGVLGMETLDAFLAALPQVWHWVVTNTLPQPKMPTFLAFALRLGAGETAAVILHATVALVVAATVAVIWRRCRVSDLRNAALCCGTLLISPYLFDYELAWLMLPGAWLCHHALRYGWQRGEREILLAAAMLPLVGSPLGQFARLQISPFVVLLLFAVIARRALISPALLPARDGPGSPAG